MSLHYRIAGGETRSATTAARGRNPGDELGVVSAHAFEKATFMSVVS